MAARRPLTRRLEAVRVYDHERDDSIGSLLRRHEVWLCAGVRRRYRICSWERDHGEFDQLSEAREFLRLLLEGNPHLVERS